MHLEKAAFFHSDSVPSLAFPRRRFVALWPVVVSLELELKTLKLSLLVLVPLSTLVEIFFGGSRSGARRAAADAARAAAFSTSFRCLFVRWWSRMARW